MRSLFFITLIFLSSCQEDDKQPNYIGGTSKKDFNDEITYIKDSRTGLCFAERGISESYSFTCVPCSEVVEILIMK